MTKAQKAKQEECREILRQLFDGQDKPLISCILHSVARSGMSRTVRILCVNPEDRLQRISYMVAMAIGFTYVPDGDAVRVQGCGMDAACELAYALSYALWGVKEGTLPEGGCRMQYEWL